MNIQIETPLGIVEIRLPVIGDVEAQMDYLYESPRKYLLGIGFNVDSFPLRSVQTKIMRERFKKHHLLLKGSAPIYEVNIVLNKKAIGQVVLIPDLGEMTAHAHFHIWDQNLRGKGLGQSVLKTSLALLMDSQNEDSIYIEPHRKNLAMNKLMKKCGFKFLGECIYSSPRTLEFPANRYLVQKNIL